MCWHKPILLLVLARDVHVAIEKEDSIVRGKTGLPFPSLSVFVQSLLDAKDTMNLGDLIDAMNLTEEWAAANGVHVSDEPYDWPYPITEDTPKHHWERLTRTKKIRMGLKYDPIIYATRYRRHNECDPRRTGWL